MINLLKHSEQTKAHQSVSKAQHGEYKPILKRTGDGAYSVCSKAIQ